MGSDVPARRAGGRRGPRAVAALLGLLAAVPALLLGTAAPAAAHARLVGVEPAANGTVAVAPSRVVLTFSEPVREPITVVVTGGDGVSAVSAPPVLEGATVVQPVRADAVEGRWAVAFRVIGDDAHPVSGTATFVVGSASGAGGGDGPGAYRSAVMLVLGLVLLVGSGMVLLAGTPRPRAATGEAVAPDAVQPADASAGGAGWTRTQAWALAGTAVGTLVVALVASGGAPQPAPPGIPDSGSFVGWARPLLRLVTEAGLVVAFGLLLGAVGLVRRPDGATRTVPARDIALAGAAAGVAALAVVGQVVVVSAEIAALGLVDAVAALLVDGGLTTFVTVDPQGRALSVQLMLAGGVAVLALGVAAGRSFVARPLATTFCAAAALALLPPLTVGHLTLTGGPGLSGALLVVHVLAAATWVGGLVALAAAAHRLGAEGLRAGLPGYSRLALGCVTALALSGVAGVVLRVDGPGDLVGGYGAIVVAKVAVLGLLVAFGAAQRRRVADLLSGATSAVGPFVRLATAEVAVMALAAGLAVALSRTPSPPRDPGTLGATTDGADALGYLQPAAPTVWRLLTGHLLDGPMLLLLAAVAAAVAVAVRGVPGRARRLSGVAAVLVLAWATVGGLGLYARVALPTDVGSHLLVTTAVPLLLLRAGVGRLVPRVGMPAPAAAAVLVLVTVGVYLPAVHAPLLAAEGGYWVRTAVGLLAAFAALARFVPPAALPGDPRAGLGAGGVLVLAAGAAGCAVLTWWLVGSRTLVGQEYFASFSVPYLRNFGNDQRTAGFVAWFAGGLPLLAALAADLVRGHGTPDGADRDPQDVDDSASLIEHS